MSTLALLLLGMGVVLAFIMVAVLLGGRDLAEGSVDGHSYRVKKGRVEIDIPVVHSMTLGRRELEEIASGVASRRTGTFAVNREVRDAVALLLASARETVVFLEPDGIRFQGYEGGAIRPIVRALLKLAGPGFSITRHAGPSVCPYCKEEVTEGRHPCDVCGAEHHDECYVEHRGCAIYGCERAPSGRRAKERG